MNIIDCRGMACPESVLAARRALDAMQFPVEVKVDSPGSLDSVCRMLASSGYRYQTIKSQDNWRLIITGEYKAAVPQQPHHVWLITSYALGRGSDELGVALMKSFLHTLSESEFPGTIYFLNSGVKLCAGPDALMEHMAALESKNWHLKSCGTCLDYHSLRDQVRVGTVTNMYEIVQGVQSADRATSI